MAEIKSLSQFKKALQGGGARPNLFEVRLDSNPPIDPQFGTSWDAEAKSDFTFLCKAAQLPASNMGSIEVPFRGRQFKVAGDRTFDTWSVTIINDTNFVIRKVMEGWMQSIGQYSDHSGLENPVDYMRNAKVLQLGRGKVNKESGNGSGGAATVHAVYQFVDIFPTNISAIDLSFDSSDTIEEFTVDFQVQFWYPDSAGNLGKVISQ